jgi:hypothetical protein
MGYLMVTTWENHWEGVARSYFTRKDIRFPVEEIREGTETVFVRVNRETRQPERAWRGSPRDFVVESDRVRFSPGPLQRIEVPEGHCQYDVGWYRYPTDKGEEAKTIARAHTSP